jgi:hypothetical protein
VTILAAEEPQQGSEKTGDPEAHAAFIGFRSTREARQCNRAANQRGPSCVVSTTVPRDVVRIADPNLMRHERPPTQQCRVRRTIAFNESRFYGDQQISSDCVRSATIALQRDNLSMHKKAAPYWVCVVIRHAHRS